MGHAKRLQAILARLFEADDPWHALETWLAEQRATNAAMGGDDDVLIGLIVNQTLQLGLPIRP